VQNKALLWLVVKDKGMVLHSCHILLESLSINLALSMWLMDGIMCWVKGATQGSIIVGENVIGVQPSQHNGPIGLSFDRHGNLYVIDNGNNRVPKFNLEFNG
jgi:hypothetical protein